MSKMSISGDLPTVVDSIGVGVGHVRDDWGSRVGNSDLGDWSSKSNWGSSDLSDWGGIGNWGSSNLGDWSSIGDWSVGVADGWAMGIGDGWSVSISNWSVSVSDSIVANSDVVLGDAGEWSVDGFGVRRDLSQVSWGSKNVGVLAD